MVSITALWLPILLAAVIVFVASSLVHMVLKYHQSDCKQPPKKTRFSPPCAPPACNAASTCSPIAPTKI